MPQPTHLLALLPLLAPATSAPPHATPLPAEELEQTIRTLVGQAAPLRGAELWAKALELREVDRLEGSDEVDRALDSLLDRGELSQNEILLTAAARMQGEEPDVIALHRVLVPLFESADEETVQVAGSLLGAPAFRGLPRGRRDELVETLLSLAADATRPPDTRLRLAQSAFQIGGGADRTQARREMRTFLESVDPELRAKGALALAASGDLIEGRLRRELERLEGIPDLRGALSGAYLERERYRDRIERRLKELEKERRQVPDELVEFNEVLEMVDRLHLEGTKVSRQELVEAAMDGMLRWMDPHSNFMGSEDYAEFIQDLEAEYSGIGAYVREDPDTGLFTIVQPIYSGPAYEVGLRTDDKIVRIGTWPTLGKPVDDIIDRLKGRPGTQVKLYVWRRGMDPELIDRPTENMSVVVERRSIEIPAGTSQLLPGGIALLELSTFSRQAMIGLQEDVRSMLDAGARAIVLDLRFNSGGLLTQAREVADLFLPEGKVVVSTEGRDQEPEVLRTRHGAIAPEDMPIVILTSRYTASASEIVSGALRDHGRAKLVGKRTFGKGSVQQLIPVNVPEDDWDDVNDNGRWDNWEPIERDLDGDGQVDYAPRLKLTIARYLLPSGRSIHRELDDDGNLLSPGGVEPDFEVDLPTMERWSFEEQFRLRDEGLIGRYLDRYLPSNRELFGHLAVNDGKDPSLYPGFDELYEEAQTTLSQDDVRRMVREELRRRVADDRGARFPAGDFVEDVQLQKAIEVALAELGETPDDVTEFGLVFDVPREESPEHPRLSALTPYSSELEDAMGLIKEARDGRLSLTPKELDELLHLLEEIEKN